MNNTQQQEWKVAAGKDAFSSPRGLHAPGCARGQHRGWGQREEKNFIRCSWLRYIAYTNVGMSSGVARAVLVHFREYIPLPYYAGPQIKFRSDEEAQEEDDLLGVKPEHLKIFPNPAGDFVSIEWDEDQFQPELLYVYNIYGQAVARYSDMPISGLTIPVTEWDNGLYMVIAMSHNGKIMTGKLIKLHH